MILAATFMVSRSHFSLDGIPDAGLSEGLEYSFRSFEIAPGKSNCKLISEINFFRKLRMNHNLKFRSSLRKISGLDYCKIILKRSLFRKNSNLMLVCDLMSLDREKIYTVLNEDFKCRLSEEEILNICVSDAA